jgi:serine phosphatase RsbU (regulator of sigma subunit)
MIRMEAIRTKPLRHLWCICIAGIIVLAIPFLTFANQKETRSTENTAVFKNKEALEIEKRLRAISPAEINSNPDSMEQVLNDYAKEYLLEKYPSSQALWYRLKAKVFAARNEFRASYEHHQKAYFIFKKHSNKKEQILSLNSMGMQCFYLSLYSEAYDYYFKGLLLAEQTGDSAGVSLICENCGNLYTYMEEYDQAEKYFNRSLAIEAKRKNPEGLFSVKNNLAAIYFHQKKYEKARLEYVACMKYYSDQGDVDMHIISMHNVASTMIELNKLSEARAMIEQSFSLIDSSLHREFLSTGHKMLGRIYLKQTDFSKAIAYTTKAIRYYEGGEDKEELGMLYLTMANAYESLGDYRSAYSYLEKHKEILKGNMNIRSQKDLLQKDAKLQFERKQVEDSLKIVSENKIKDARLSQQTAELKLKRNQQVFMIFAVLLLASALAVIYKRLRINEKQRKIIGIQKDRVEEQNQEILSSIEYARRIQRAILPSPHLIKNKLPEHFLIYLPKDIVAGDFYWMQEAGGRLYFAVCDCTGHGVPGAMVSVVCYNALNRALNEFGERDPGRLLDKTRELVVENFSGSDENVQDGMDASLLCFLPEQGKLLWSGANHPLWIFRKDSGTMETMKPDKQSIGKTYLANAFNTHEITLGKGDTVYFFTDGYADQFGGEDGKKLTRKKFMLFLNTIANLPMEEQRKRLLEFHHGFKGKEEQVDDICVMGLRF